MSTMKLGTSLQLTVALLVSCVAIAASKPLRYHRKNVDADCARCKDSKPIFDKETLKEIIQERDPLPPPTAQEELFSALSMFKDEVVLLLVSVKDVEGWAILSYMTPPECSNGQPLYTGNQTINFYNSMQNTMLTLGMFGDHKTALLWAKIGEDSRVEIENALQLLPNVQLVAGVGEAYGIDREKTRFGDVLVSTTIDGIGNVQWDNGNLTFGEGDNRYTRINQRALDVFATEVDDWATVTKFQVTKSGRIPNVYADIIISMPWFISDANILNQIVENNPLAIGGEIEGQVLAAIHNDLLGLNQPKELDIIIIKGVSEFAGGQNADDSSYWSLTACMAAAGYMEFKLKQTRGQVYRISGSLETSNSARDNGKSIDQTPPEDSGKVIMEKHKDILKSHTPMDSL